MWGFFFFVIVAAVVVFVGSDADDADDICLALSVFVLTF